MKKLNLKTQDLAKENIAKLSKIFPSVVKEGKVDFELLKQFLSDYLIDGCKERYGLNWVGKKESILKANTPINKTLRPVLEKSVDFENTKNLYIEGDNFEVLKVIQESYLNKIKMIYIDPPYNTGKDFIYKDNFKQNKEEYEKEIESINEEGIKLYKNTDTNGRFHSDWLSMMFERLLIARDLLREDGVIFISIDDNEVHNLRHICDEVFGEGNFVGMLKWKRKKQPSFLTNHISEIMEYIIVYGKNKAKLENLSIEKRSDSNTRLDNATNKINKRFFNKGIRVKIDNIDVIKAGTYKNKTMEIEFLNDIYIKNGRTVNDFFARAKFRDSQSRIDNFIESDLIFITKNFGLRRDLTKEELERRKNITDLLLDWGDNQDSEKEIKALFDNLKYFDYPKPIKLIKNLVKSIYSDNEIILDFFSGSATTAHAVMELNAEDNGNRQFIMVQIPELVDEKSEAYKAGYKTICDIGRERIIKAAEKIKSQYTNNQYTNTLDLGFRYFKLDSSNFKESKDISEITQENIFDDIDNINPKRTDLDLLFEVILSLGLELTLNIQTKNILDKKVYFVEDSLIACFDDNIDENLAKELAKFKPSKIVLKDSSFITDSDKINFEESLKELTPQTDIWVV